MPRTFFGKSLKTQLTVLLFGLTAISILVVGFLGVRAVVESGHDTEVITSKATKERAAQLLNQTAQATAAKNSVIFTDVQRRANDASQYTANLLENPQFFSNSHWKYDATMSKLAGGQYSNNNKELSSVFASSVVPQTAAMKRVMELTSYLDYYAPQVLKSQADIVALYYINSDGASRYYPNIGLAALSEPDFKPQEQEFFTAADPTHNPGKTAQWTSVYDDPAGNGLLITASQPVFANNAFVGVIGADFTLANIAKNIEGYQPIESSYAFLIDDKGRAVALPEQGYKDMLGRKAKDGEFGPDLTKVRGDFAAVLRNMEAGQTGFRTVGAAGSNRYVAYAPLEGTNFSLGIVAPENVMLQVVGDLQEQVQQSRNNVLFYQIVPIAVLLLALVWLIGFVYIRFLTQPIITLTKNTNRLIGSPLDEAVEIEVPRTVNNEVGTLTAAFNHMIRELSGSYKALQNKVVEIGDAKAKDDAIINSIGDGVIITDPLGQILLINAIAADLMGFDSNRAGRVDDNDMHDEKGKLIPPPERPMQQALASGQKVSRVVMAGRDGDAKAALSITASPVRQNDRTIGSIQIIRDVTKEKQVDRMKTEFISIASHQLRTPLSAIKWFAEMLLHGDAGKLEEEQGEYVENISLSTDRMIALVNSLLNISRLESGRILIEPVPTDLKELVATVVEDLQPKIDKHAQHLELNIGDDLPKINLDGRLISQVYMNLLSNAVKYTPKGGTITLTITIKDNAVLSEVRDTGYGIPPAEQKKLFTKFFRGSNIVQVETDGTGLGMYLAKSVVESSQGRIWFESEEGRGTTFWFTLPLDGMRAKDGEVTLD